MNRQVYIRGTLLSWLLFDLVSELPLTWFACAYYTITATAQAHTPPNIGAFGFLLSLGLSVSPGSRRTVTQFPHQENMLGLSFVCARFYGILTRMSTRAMGGRQHPIWSEAFETRWREALSTDGIHPTATWRLDDTKQDTEGHNPP